MRRTGFREIRVVQWIPIGVVNYSGGSLDLNIPAVLRAFIGPIHSPTIRRRRPFHSEGQPIQWPIQRPKGPLNPQLASEFLVVCSPARVPRVLLPITRCTNDCNHSISISSHSCYSHASTNNIQTVGSQTNSGIGSCNDVIIHI